KEKRSEGVRRWLRHHPLLAAASLFIFLMGASLFSGWNDDDQFSVTAQPNLIVENGVVVVPEGEVVEGDITVKNGDIRIEGEVNGDVTVINGEKYMASAGNVTGEIEEINQMFERSEEHTSELQSRENLVCRLLLEKKKSAKAQNSRAIAE